MDHLIWYETKICPNCDTICFNLVVLLILQLRSTILEIRQGKLMWRNWIKSNGNLFSLLESVQNAEGENVLISYGGRKLEHSGKYSTLHHTEWKMNR